MARGVLPGVIAALFVILVAYLAVQPFPSDVADSPWTVRWASHKFTWWRSFHRMLPRDIQNYLTEWSNARSRRSGPAVPYKDELFDQVPVRVFADEPTKVGKPERRSAGVYYHGGGFVYGSPDDYHPLTAHIARDLNSVVISVDYRLAPEHPFPAAVDDCTAATVWFLKHAKDYNVDPKRVAVMGDSAGGNLAAAVAQRLTFDPEYRKLPRIKLQVLIYPCLQAFDFQTPSYQRNGDISIPLPGRRLMVFFWNKYLHGNKRNVESAMMTNNHTSIQAKISPLVKKCLSHDLIPEEFKKTGYEVPSTDFGDEVIYEHIKHILLDSDFAPLMREDLRGLPETYIMTAGYDVLRDDGIMYAKRLEKAGVKVTLNDYLRGFHGMFGTGDSCLITCTPMGDQIFADFIEFAKKRL